jgi:hypothetical protein
LLKIHITELVETKLDDAVSEASRFAFSYPKSEEFKQNILWADQKVLALNFRLFGVIAGAPIWHIETDEAAKMDIWNSALLDPD